jgi:hypothetical protein
MLLQQIKGCIWLYRCDWCLKEFEAVFSKSKSKTNGCNRSCASKASRATVKANLLEKYGVENVSQLASVRDKVKQTTLERYGVECSWQNASVKQKIKSTMVERHGADSPWRVPAIREKIELANIEKFGTSHVWGNSEIREKSKQTMIERYGVDNPQKSEDIKQRTKQTCIERYSANNPLSSPVIRERIRKNHIHKYGVDNPSQRSDVKLKKIATSLKNYGVEHPMQSEEIQQKRFKSFLTNGKGLVSKIEFRCLMALRELFKEVIHQHSVNGWMIDFYIPSQETYIQFDGVYWHGLNLSKEQLENPTTKRMQDIASKWKRDRDQDKWFLEHSKKLVRIREDEFVEWERSNLVSERLTTFPS